MKIREEIGITFDDVLLVPQKSDLASRSDVDLTTQLTKKVSIKTPIISANMDTVTEADMAIALAESGGIGIIHRFLTIDQEAAQVKAVKERGHLVGGAIGIHDDAKKRTRKLVEAGCDVVVIDIAHGHSTHLLKKFALLRKTFPNTEFVLGNIATADAASDLIKAGADSLKVGIGPGSLCTTRVVAGSGVPQITAIADVVSIASRSKVPVIADGGIRTSGDIVKALAAGASSVMIGSYFAGCAESPALTFFKNGDKYKLTRGMASLTANQDRLKNDHYVKRDLKKYTAEGVEAIVRFKGSVTDLVTQMVGGIRSGFSYSGARNINQLWDNAEFVQISTSALIESRPHDVSQI